LLNCPFLAFLVIFVQEFSLVFVSLLLSSDLHKTFDKYCWSINPNTLKIEINKNINDCGKIKNYEDTIVNIKLNNRLYNNLLYHYNIFSKDKNIEY
jgi:hypothetical protein